MILKGVGARTSVHSAQERLSARWNASHKRERLKNPAVRKYVEAKMGIGWSLELEIERWLNDRPRKCLGYKTPMEVYNELSVAQRACPCGTRFDSVV
ncbi:MAG: hypothetical protein HQK86_13105 [Nitrospinae bacterium]|nr:hypothetical protein [Nitrospinota bacterium]MBF0635178.1 hypothetical protein [Nitrospinota bacterium]